MAKAQIATRPFTKKEVEDAAADARKLIVDSSVIRTSVSMMILSRQLYQLARGVLDTELQHGWEIENLPLVIQTLVLSAQEKSTKAVKLSDVQLQLLQLAVPYVDILLQQQREASPETSPVDDIPVEPIPHASDDPSPAG